MGYQVQNCERYNISKWIWNIDRDFISRDKLGNMYNHLNFQSLMDSIRIMCLSVFLVPFPSFKNSPWNIYSASLDSIRKGLPHLQLPKFALGDLNNISQDDLIRVMIAPLCPIWPGGPTWILLDPVGSTWTELNQVEPGWTRLDPLQQCWPWFNQVGFNWTGLTWLDTIVNGWTCWLVVTVGGHAWHK